MKVRCKLTTARLAVAVATVLACSSLAAPGLAEEPDEKEDSGVFTLGKIEVSTKSDSRKNTVVSRVTAEEMQQFDANTIGEAANLLSGVTSSVTGKRGESGFNVRGFDNRRTPIYLDGIPMYVPYDGNIDTGRFMTHDLAEIDISKGFASVLYGPNTLGGAVNMISKRPAREFEGNIGAGYTSGDTYRAYANLGTNQKRWYLQAGGSWTDVHAFELSGDFKPTKYEDGNRRENSYSRDGKGSVKLGFTPNRTDEYTLSYIYQHGEKGVPVYAGGNAGSLKKVSFWRWPWWDKQSLYFSSNTAIADKSYIKSRIYYDQFKNSLNQYKDATYSTYATSTASSDYSPSRYDDYTIGTSLEAGTTLIPKNSLKMSFHFKDDVHRDSSSLSPESRYEDQLYSIGLEDTFEFTRKLTAVAGISYDRLVGQEAHKYDFATKSYINAPLADTDAVNAQLTLFYAYSDSGKLHASVARKTRFPSMKERTTTNVYNTNIANPYLKPESSVNYELGVDENIAGRVRIKSNIFFNAISDYIANVYTGVKVTYVDASGTTQTGDQSQFRNSGRLNRYGYEFEALAPITDSVETGFNYTFIYDDALNNNGIVTDIPKHKLFVYGKLTPVKPLSIFASAEYNSARSYSPSANAYYKLKDFVVVNTKVGYEAMRGLTLEAGVNNIFDRNYALAEGYPEPGRSYFFQAKYQF